MTQTAASPAATGTNPVKVTEYTGTEYVILEKDPSGYWNDAGTITARDTNSAIEKHAQGTGLENKDAKSGTFIAIPASRWKPVKVTPQTVTTLKLEEAK